MEVLRANGVRVVFGLNGDHVLKLYEGLADAPEITHVTVKHENTAALAAEVYGRLTGRPGVAVVTAGPGALNSISGVASAFAAGAPVVHLSGAVPKGADRETFHGVDTEDFSARCFQAVTKSCERVTRAEEIQGALGRAFALAVAGRPGPAHVEITRDVLEGPPFAAPPPPPAPLAGSGAGGGARPPAGARARRGAPDRGRQGGLVPAGQRGPGDPGRGPGGAGGPHLDGHAAMPTVHPLSLGAYRAQGSHPAVRRALQDADLVLGVGVRPGTEAARTLHADATGRLLLLDPADRPVAPWPHLAGVPALAADLRALAEGLPARGTPPDVIETCRQARLAQARGLELELARHAGTRPWHVGLALAALDERLTPEIVVTTDVSNVKLWAPLQLRAFGPHSHIQAGSWGTMGYALPAAIGAALALPGHKVVALAGDASFLMSSSDLVTLAQLRLPVVVAVHHDGRIGMIEYMQTAAGRAPYATEVGDVDYARYAEAAGIPARRVDDPAELGAAWDEALAAGGPYLIELMAGHAFPRPSLPRLVEQGLR